jgi:hypothetical protein
MISIPINYHLACDFGQVTFTLIASSFERDAKPRFIVPECLCQGKQNILHMGKCVTFCGLQKQPEELLGLYHVYGT